MKKTSNFSFAEHHAAFDDHKERSIPGYKELASCFADLSSRFVQDDTQVVDYGCSTGRFLATVRESNRSLRSNVRYVGIDIEEAFRKHWAELITTDCTFEVGDVRDSNHANISLACSLFVVQFLPSWSKVGFLRRVCDGLVPGGALMIAEKQLATTGRMQDALAFQYYDFKQSNGFSAAEILEKERQLRGQMTLWTMKEMQDILKSSGFRDIQTVWERFPFVGAIALK